MKTKVNVQLRRIEKALAASSTAALPVKLRMAEVILRLMERRKKFGLLVILGWRNQWKSYADTPDISQDLFAQRRINIMKIPERTPRNGNIVNTVNFDGAILIDARGNVLHSGTMIEGLRPRATAHKLSPRPAPDLSSHFGFKRKVHMRHITAITSSYTFRGTTVFTVSEETDDLHIFEGGKIVYSTVRGEMR
jgi:DNA integrity scanning protein DisA with diadenylate cyclase activity